MGDMVLAGVQQGPRFAGAEVEEARACLFGLKQAIEAGLTSLVIEGDSLSLIQKLRAKQVPNNALGLFLQEIFSLVSCCDFIAWSFVKRSGNKVAHTLAHWQPICPSPRIWDGFFPDSIVINASEDLYGFYNAKLI